MSVPGRQGEREYRQNHVRDEGFHDVAEVETQDEGHRETQDLVFG